MLNILLRYLNNRGLRQTKVALRCEHEEELLLLEAQAQSLDLCAQTIQDACVFLLVVLVSH